MTHLSRTYHALIALLGGGRSSRFRENAPGIIYIVYNTRELTQTGNKNAKNVRIYYRSVIPFLAVFALEDDGDDDGEAEEGGIEEIRDDADGADAGKAGGHEQLGAVRQDALHTAAGGIQEAGAAARVDVELLRYALGDIADGEDSDGVIRCTDIGEGDESADTPFGAGATFDMPRHTVDDEVQATDIAEDSEDTAREHGDEDEFAHAHDTLRSAADPTHQVVTAVDDAREAGEDIARREHDQDVDAASGADKDREVG